LANCREAASLFAAAVASGSGAFCAMCSAPASIALTQLHLDVHLIRTIPPAAARREAGRLGTTLTSPSD
jgi:hypothetical protein